MTHALIEPLEARIAPATLVSGAVVTYKDAHGDLVTIKSSKAIFTPANIDLILKFDVGNGSSGNATPQQLQLVDLTKALSSAVSGSELTIVSQTNAGHGFVDVGYIKSSNISLKKVVVDGDLGRIDAGIVTEPIGLKSLTVQSLGVKGVATQAAGGNLTSSISSGVGSLLVKGDVQTALVSVISGISNAPGNIGKLTIGGSLRGGPAGTNGLITAAGAIGKISIGGDIVGGAATNTGAIRAGGAIGSVKIGGGILGDAGMGSGSILSGFNSPLGGNIGAISIGTDLKGGDGPNSGQINASGKLPKVQIGGSVLGGKGAGSGSILSGLAMGKISIGHDLKGSLTVGAAAKNGEIVSGGSIDSLSLGSLLGGIADYSGFVTAAGDIGKVTLANLTGNSALDTGAIIAGGKINKLTVTQNITGGAGLNSGSIFSGDDLGKVKINGNVTGDLGPNSGQINAGGKLKEITIGGSLLGGGGNGSGAIQSGASIGSALVKGDVKGLGGDDSGQISSGLGIGAVTINQSLLGGVGKNSGAILSHTIFSETGDVQGDIGKVRIGANVTGNAGEGSGVISAAGKLGSVSVGHDVTGSILSGVDFVTSGGTGSIVIGGNLQGGSVRSADDLQALTVKGSVIGTAANPVIISARGQSAQTGSDLAIKNLTVNHDVQFARILAGYSPDLFASNPDAQIGKVKIGGNWDSSSLVAGARDVNSNGFGNADDAKISGPGTSADNAGIVSRIASVIIGGAISNSGGTQTGFEAQQIAAFKFNGNAVTLHNAPPADVIDPLGAAGVSLREIAL